MAKTDNERARVRHPLAWGVLATAGLTGLLLSACSSSPTHEAAAKKPKPTTTTSTAPPPACPLTGQPAPGGVVPPRPAMAVKIDNYPAGRPQSARYLPSPPTTPGVAGALRQQPGRRQSLVLAPMSSPR